MSLNNSTLYLDHLLVKAKNSVQWETDNTVLMAGELGYESDTSRYKLGDGSTAWNSLAYQDASILAAISSLNSRVSAIELLVAQYELLAEAQRVHLNSLIDKLDREESGY
ncbi:MAG: hypothetical protein IJH62_00105 [Mogibacterium sp.]|nr:hypothetical protein [Mogibacterium sp.]